MTDLADPSRTRDPRPIQHHPGAIRAPVRDLEVGLQPTDPPIG